MTTQHTLRASVHSVHRGFFDAKLPAVLTIRSGDSVAVTTLSGNPEDLPDASAGFTILPEHREVLAGVPAGESVRI